MRPTSNGSNNFPITSRDDESTESDVERQSDSDDSNEEEYEEVNEDDGKTDMDRDQGQVNSHGQNKLFVHRSKGLRFSKRLAGVPGHTIPESMNLGAKNRLRQRPSVNTAVELLVVPDSEDESPLRDMR